MKSTLPRPAYDEELGRALAELNFPINITPALIPSIRQKPVPAIKDILGAQPISQEERSIAGPRGPITLAIFRPSSTTSTPQTRPALLWMHGGGFFSGNRFGSIQNQLDLVTHLDAICISIEYRLGPEHQDPAPLEDCYAALVWVGENLRELGIDPARLMIGGSSAGGGLAAGVALYA
jgi:acetyl esterase/lipase